MGDERVRRIRLRENSVNPAEAAMRLERPGDASLVVRGLVRSLVVRCPCGCGDNYIINLDSRAGPAWRYYRRDGKLSLYPSYWRDGGCGAHFIINRNEIWWCSYGEDWFASEENAGLAGRVLTAAPVDEAFAPRDLAEVLDETPWDVWGACERLARQGALRRVGENLDARFVRVANRGR